MIINAKTYKYIESFFPTTVNGIEKLVVEEIQQSEIDLKNIIELENNRTFINTVYAFDLVQGRFYTLLVLLQAIESVSPNQEMRDAAYHNGLKLRAFAIDNFLQNKKIYNVLKDYCIKIAPTENLNSEQTYFLENLLKSYERNGLDLSDKNLERLKNIKKELEEHKLSFKRNIAADNRVVEVTREELKGLSDSFINKLKQSNNKYVLSIDLATYNEIIESCEVQSTRKIVWHEFNNRAYPANKNELAQIIALRDEWARMVGYASFAELDISGQMAHNVYTVENFLQEVISKAEDKFGKEITHLKNYLPESVQLTTDGKFKSWDIHFVKATYRKNYLTLSEEEISNYFPLDNTLQQLLILYEKFLGVTLKEHKNIELWDDTVTTVTVHKDGLYLGAIVLDLFSRKGKVPYACFLDIVPATLGYKTPAIGLVMANFTKPANEQPALLKLSNVRTFFHEFGHALHSIVGATLMPSLAGVRVKSDFLEMPSQMLEEWMWDPNVLKSIGKHYQTGQSLPGETIKKILELKHFDSGYWIKRQASLAKLSLELYKAGSYKDIEEIQKKAFGIVSCVEYDDNNHDYASFWHLTDYGSKYYSYLWSKVFALDLFSKIKQEGLFNPETGKKYLNLVLSKGGSVEPQELINNFLGRQSTIEAFFQDMHIA